MAAELEAVYVSKSGRGYQSKQFKAKSQQEAIRSAQARCPQGYYLSDIYSVTKGVIVWSKGPGWGKGTQNLFQR